MANSFLDMNESSINDCSICETMKNKILSLKSLKKKKFLKKSRLNILQPRNQSYKVNFQIQFFHKIIFMRKKLILLFFYFHIKLYFVDN